ncbi:MAG TPA: hypothetical protein VF787_15105 [Thermoanaerobaculia bacterium]
MQTLGSPASLSASIREDADAEVERLEELAANELATIASEASTANVTIPDREERLAAARRASEERIARQEWAGRRAAIEQREQWIQRVVAKAQESWTATAPPTLESFIREARSHLPDGEYEVILSPRGGCIVASGDFSFDNTFDARSQRLEPEWRRLLSGMYAP